MSTLPTLTCLHVAPLHRSLHQCPNIFHLSPIFWQAGHQSALKTTIHSPSKICFQSVFYSVLIFLLTLWAELLDGNLIYLSKLVFFGNFKFFLKYKCNNSPCPSAKTEMLTIKLGYCKNLFPIVVINLDDISTDISKIKHKNNVTHVK